MSASPHPHFFIVRPGGTKTPLIAVDEVPSDFHILGVPPVISDAQTQGMVSLGLIPSSGRRYIVQQDGNSPSSSASFGPSSQSDSDKHGLSLPRKYEAPDAGLNSMESLSPANNILNNSQERCDLYSTSDSSDAAGRAQWCRPELRVDETQAIIDAVTRVSGGKALQQGQHTLGHSATGSSQPTQGKKIYCNYWLRKGECDYMQQGCLYKHEMPLDKATLASLGLREVPRWYREQWASVAASVRPQREDHVNRPWRASKTAASFSDPQPDAPGALPPASTDIKHTQIRQTHAFASLLPPSPAIRPKKEFEMSEQRQRLNSSQTNGSIAPSCNGSNGARLEIPKRNNEAQPVQPGSIAPNTPVTPTRATGQSQSAHRRHEGRSRHQRDHARSAAEPVAAIPVMMPSQAPLESSSQEAPHQISYNATFYPGVPRTASPAHPRLFVKEGQGRYAVNPSAESKEPKTVVGRKSNNQVAKKQSSKSLNIFDELGI